RLDAAQRVEIVVPREAELRNVVLVDLVERAEALRAIRAPVHQPVGRIRRRVAQALGGHASTRAGRRSDRTALIRPILTFGAAPGEEREQDAGAEPETAANRRTRANLHDAVFPP